MKRGYTGEEAMKYFSRPYNAIALAAVLGAGLALGPAGAAAQSINITQVLDGVDPLLSHSSSQGYLGVLVSDVDNDSAAKLKLKETRGALITLIDHDAPAGQIGLRVNDVVLELNGQKVEGAEQFGRIIREIPAGRKVSLLISRDGNTQTMEVQLCDRKMMEKDVWNRLRNQGDGASSAPTWGILAGNPDAPMPGFHMPFVGSTLNVGAMVEPLTPQMSDFLGVSNGILVKQVTRKSEAAAAGLQKHDVILKVGNDAISTTADWDRALRSNQGKSVQITILRDRKQQIVNLQVDSKHKSEVEYPGLLPDGPCPMLAEMDPAWRDDALAAAEELRQQAEEWQRSFNPDDFKIDPKEMEQLKQQMEEFQKSFNTDVFKVDPKEMEQFRKDMEQLGESFKADDFKIDPKQMDELKRQMEEFRKSMPQLFQYNKQQLQQFKHEMEQMRMNISTQV